MAVIQESPEGVVQIELFRRSYVPETFEERIEEIRDRVERLVATGTVDTMRVHDWNKCVRVSVQPRADTDAVECVERYRQFAEWAEEAGADLSPFFDVQREGRYEVITFPILCVAVTSGDDLLAVAPCRIDGDAWTVPAYLDAMEAGEEWVAPLRTA